MLNAFSQFKDNESGAVTVDWVVLTAAIVGIALAVIGLISSGVGTASEGINSELETAGLLGGLFGSSSTVYGADSGFTPYAFRYDESYIEGLALDAAQLESTYQTAYDAALANPDPWNLDELAGFEKAMVDSGVGVPDGNLSAADIQADSGLT